MKPRPEEPPKVIKRACRKPASDARTTTIWDVGFLATHRRRGQIGAGRKIGAEKAGAQKVGKHDKKGRRPSRPPQTKAKHTRNDYVGFLDRA